MELFNTEAPADRLIIATGEMPADRANLRKAMDVAQDDLRRQVEELGLTMDQVVVVGVDHDVTLRELQPPMVVEDPITKRRSMVEDKGGVYTAVIVAVWKAGSGTGSD